MRATLLCGLLAASWAALALPATSPWHLVAWLAAGAAWAAALRWWPAPRAALVVGVWLALRLPAYVSAPAHSDDVYRYLWDGRVQRAGINPYVHAPDDAALAALRDDDWAHINNRRLPSIYPPLAQLAFRAAASLPLPALAGWKLLLALADALVLASLLAGARARPESPPLAIAWAWSPLVGVELAQEAHVDALAVAALVAALFAWQARRRWLAGALLGASGAIKLLTLALLPATRSARACLAAALLVAACAAPFLGAGAQVRGSLGEYGRRWRANDGAFALVHAATTFAVAHTRFRERRSLAGSPRLVRAITGRDRDEIYPDEVAALAARAVVLAFFALALALAWRALPRDDLAGFAEVATGAFLLLTPTAHPWYALWLVGVVAFGRARAAAAWVWFAVLTPLAYLPLADFRAGGRWLEPWWTRALIHGGAWLFLAARSSALTDRLRRVLSRGKPMRAATLCLLATVVAAAPAGATVVRGTVSLSPEWKARLDAPVGRWRVENGVLPIAPQTPDPRSEAIVVLEASRDKARSDVKLDALTVEMAGLRFSPRAAWVPVGCNVVIKNNDRAPHTISVDGGLLAPTTLPAGQSHAMKASVVGEYIVHAEEPHMIASIVASHGWGVTADDKGGFKLDVPEGSYTLKVFFRGAWVHEQPLTVAGKITEVSLTLTPSRAAAAAPQAGAKR